MLNFKRAIASVLTFVALAAGSLVAASPASASYGQCPGASICFYTATGGKSYPVSWTVGQVVQSEGISFYGLSYDNSFSSIKNNSNGTFFVYDGWTCNFASLYFTVNPGVSITLENTNWNDKASSFEETSDGSPSSCN